MGQKRKKVRSKLQMKKIDTQNCPSKFFHRNQSLRSKKDKVQPLWEVKAISRGKQNVGRNLFRIIQYYFFQKGKTYLLVCKLHFFFFSQPQKFNKIYTAVELLYQAEENKLISFLLHVLGNFFLCLLKKYIRVK